MGEQVTIYVTASLRADIRRAAFETDRKISHLVADAMREYLQRRGLRVSEEKGSTLVAPPSGPSTTPGLDDVVKALAEQAAAIRDLREELRSLRKDDRSSEHAMPEGMLTEVERMVLQIVRQAGPKGIDGIPFQAALKAAGYSLGQSREATSELQRAGLLRKKYKAWVCVDPSSSRRSST